MTEVTKRYIVALYLRDAEGNEVCSAPVFEGLDQLVMPIQKTATICKLEIVLNDGFKTTIDIPPYPAVKDDVITMPMPNLVPTP